MRLLSQQATGDQVAKTPPYNLPLQLRLADLESEHDDLRFRSESEWNGIHVIDLDQLHEDDNEKNEYLPDSKALARLAVIEKRMQDLSSKHRSGKSAWANMPGQMRKDRGRRRDKPGKDEEAKVNEVQAEKRRRHTRKARLDMGVGGRPREPDTDAGATDRPAASGIKVGLARLPDARG